jgi:adenylate kinase family enzyme
MSDGAQSGLDLANASRRVAVVGVSGNGKTTFSRELASRLEVPYVELDALFHLSGWREADEEDFRRSVEQAMSSDGWVLDGSYFRILGPLILERADTVVWLDQPLPLVLLRLVRRAIRDIVTKRDLFNGNRQTWRYAFFVRDSLVSYAVKAHFRRRRIWPELFARQAHLRVVRLRSPHAVAGWLETQGAAA